MVIENESMLTIQQTPYIEKLEKLNRKIKEMGNRIALLEASLLTNMAMNGGSISEPVSMRGGGLSGSSSMTNSLNSVDNNGEYDNHALRKRTLV